MTKIIYVWTAETFEIVLHYVASTGAEWDLIFFVIEFRQNKIISVVQNYITQICFMNTSFCNDEIHFLNKIKFRDRKVNSVTKFNFLSQKSILCYSAIVILYYIELTLAE